MVNGFISCKLSIFQVDSWKCLSLAPPKFVSRPLSKISYDSSRDFCQVYWVDTNLYFVGLQISSD